MGAPFKTGTWNGVEAAYYTGHGGQWELIWLAVSIAMCVIALIVGGMHESISYGREEGRSLGPRAMNDNSEPASATDEEAIEAA